MMSLFRKIPKSEKAELEETSQDWSREIPDKIASAEKHAEKIRRLRVVLIAGESQTCISERKMSIRMLSPIVPAAQIRE